MGAQEVDIDSHLASARSLATAAAAEQQQALTRFKNNFPKRTPTPSERSGIGVWSQEAARLVIARENGAPSWGGLCARVLAEHSEPMARFIRSVLAGDASGLRTLLEEEREAVLPHLDAPLFYFDAPAVVQQKRNRGVLEVLIGAGADIKARSDFWAGGFGVLDDVDEDQAHWLLERGATLDLATAAGLGWLDQARVMLGEQPDLVSQGFGDGKTALHWAKTVEMAELLLAGGADINARDIDHGSTAAEHLIGKDSEVPRFLVEQGAEHDLFLAAALGDTNRVLTALEQHPQSLRYRIGRPPYLRVSDDWGGHIYQWTLGGDRSPHEVAFERGHREAYQLLLSRSDDTTRFLAACLCDDAAGLAALDDASAVAAELCDDDLQLMPIAAWNGRLGAVRKFLDFGLDPHRPGPEDSTPIDRASFRGWAEIVELLLERDPDPPLERRNRFGGTPLSACVHGAQMGGSAGCDHVRTVVALLKAGAKFDVSWLPTGVAAIDRIFQEALEASPS